MVWYDTLPFFESADAFTTQLTAGTDYTLEFSRNFTDSLGTRSPHFEVTDPNGTILSPDVFTHSLYPRENPAIICYTFTPETSGLYAISVRNAYSNLSDDVKTESVLFVYEEMHNEDGENGYPSRFMLADGAETVDVRNIIQLRKIILEANPNYIDYLSGKNTALDEINDDTGEFDNWLGVMRSNAGIYDDGRVTGGVTASAKVIPTTVQGIPYDDRFSLGKGLMSTSDKDIFVSAIKPEYLNIPVPQAKKGKWKFNYNFIESVEDYEREISANTELSFSYNSVGGGASASYSNSFKFGLTSITFMLHYEEYENSYRELSPNCELNTEALNILLNQGSDAFRSNYGDYFVAGHLYGGFYNAFITITTESSAQTSEIKASLQGSYKQGVAVDANFAANFKNALNGKNASVTVEVNAAGANDNLPDTKVLMTGPEAIDTVVKQLSRNNLAKAFTPESYTPIKVILRRYYTLARANISQSMPFTTAHWSNIRALNSELVTVRGLYNSVTAIPNAHINGDVKTGYFNRFDSIRGKLDTAFYENPGQVTNMINEAKTLKKDLQALLDRYVFYRMLVTAQSWGPWEKVPLKRWGIGYTSCLWSDVVQPDINAGMSAKEHVERKWGDFQPQSWQPDYRATQSNGNRDAVFIYFTTWRGDGRYDWDEEGKADNPPIIGKKRVKFTFRRGATSAAKWEVERKTMRFNSTLYPFKGLAQ